jgi:uncharacterized C2H2 Zn-finger protein
MSDLGLGPDATVTCERCAAQNDRNRLWCSSCGAPLDVSITAETERGDLELGEAQRALDAEGHETRFGLATDGRVRCPVCAALFVPDESVIDELYEARDTPTGRDGIVVLGVRCPKCETLGQVEADAADLALSRSAGDVVAPHPEEVPENRAGVGKPGASPDHPLGDTRSLRERGSLLDAEGEDIRQYTGEPVETEEGTVIPRQQNAGPGNIAGGGEWPDPNASPAQPDE